MNDFQIKLNHAIQLHQNGQVLRALSIYRELLNLQKNNPQLLFMLGTAYFQTGEHERGIKYIEGSIERAPNPISYNNLGVMYSLIKKYDKSIRNFEAAIKLSSDYAEAHCNLGAAFREMGHFEKSIRSCDQAISLAPNYAQAYLNRGNSLNGIKRFNEAVEAFDKSIALNSNSPDAFFGKGLSLFEVGKFDAALLNYDNAISLNPKNSNAFFNRAKALGKLGRISEAIESYREAIELNPKFFEAYNNLGIVFSQINQLEQAEKCYNLAININPIYAEAYSNLGLTLEKLNRLTDALSVLKKSTELKPDYADAYSNLGIVFHHMQDVDDALSCFNKALSLNPNHINSKWNKSLLLLLIGQYTEGWELHESRWAIDSLKHAKRSFNVPLWLGTECLKKKTLLVYPEQGLGDVIQFSRYLPLIKDLGANVIFEVPASLQRIMKSLPCEISIIASGDEIPAFDFHCPIMSLPLAFKTTAETIPAKIPYLNTKLYPTSKWAERFKDKRSLRVGLVWSGGFREDQPETWTVNNRRNIPLSMLRDWNVEGVQFYSLQKGKDAVDQLNQLEADRWGGPKIIDYSSEFDDFYDTAALIHHLDLVITVDTSTAHIAGALGKPTWLLNRLDTDWRWFLDKEFSPWYPTTRIFRQKNFGDWANVISDVRCALGALSMQHNANHRPSETEI